MRLPERILDCPVVMMPVHLSYLSFGVGTSRIPSRLRSPTSGPRALRTTPRSCMDTWRTPPIPGHYCLQAVLDPVADVNPGNNLGQHNTSVVRPRHRRRSPSRCATASPRAAPVRVLDRHLRTGPISPCTADPEELAGETAYHRGDHPLPAGWTSHRPGRTGAEPDGGDPGAGDGHAADRLDRRPDRQRAHLLPRRHLHPATGRRRHRQGDGELKEASNGATTNTRRARRHRVAIDGRRTSPGRSAR